MGDIQEPVIEVRNLRVDFPGRRGTVTALSDVSLSIRPGEILGVVGESGAGKSMTGLAIQGLLEAPGHIAGGEVWLGKRRIDTLDDRAMEKIRGREIGAIFQDPLTSLNPLFSVGAQLVETIRRHLGLGKAEARARAVQLLRDVGIPSPEERVNQYPHQFSGGMRQRVVIALALAASPKLVIADEPTTALDVSIQAQIISLLRKLCKEKQAAVMLVTHDMGVIAEAADRIAVMYAGRLIEIGAVEQVLHQPRHPYTQGLMASIPSLGARVERLNQIDGSMPRLDAIPEGCAFNPRCKMAGPRCRRERPELVFAGQSASACWLSAGGTA
ncbi:MULTISPECIES: ABC transporter ATP-binding protein [Sinorhizobium]|jgi:peptide/nickel transport system ATP-binding protein|uniref:ABC transporter ATP-binding protein n=1 Tax=Rhizobium meliloti TaxID=382 RepID=A0A2J0Z4W1_RHIML|nr:MULTISPECIES: ABC transporter ATP-binding protein [Sinorhizobium]PND23200.1 ABC transporter ATP-binding protein [Ensifer sp. MMN_5]GCA51605.1 oligopeptide transport ATP-binding protein OppD [Sinorhizobium sp. KGO-5]PJR15524.1 ABC transporter ATP-binding protein [Sinorhizobium meliloti]PND28509.1 ABC transporter ATP-binding protein [Sinorhizobium sp. M4_45]WEJ15943.1 ABC transporter ATP-binding protein [Sinorhizobium sp. K101]